MWPNERDESGGAPADPGAGGPRHLGEFGVIAHLTEGLPTRPDVILGPGDDAALLDTGASDLLVATCDAQVEGTHFIRDLATFEEIGHKALAVNLSDVAAMGAEPRWALVSLSIPDGLQISDLDHVYSGMRGLAGRYSVALVGGNISHSPGPFGIDVTLLGAVPRSRALLRAGARIGDKILVTGALGAAAAGTLWLVSAPDPELLLSLSSQARKQTRQAMVAPLPHVAEGRAVAASGAATAMTDVSDGVALDLWHICQASHVGAVLEAAWLPIDPSAREVAGVYGQDPLSLALHGGEDYVLLLTAREDAVEAAQEAISAAGGVSHVIGHVVHESLGMQLRFPDGELQTLEPRGWDHLASKSSRQNVKRMKI
ncbi:MAG: thiamine-phosphate kinase [Ktedonobacterales bacterium]